MPRNGSGTYTLPSGNPVTSGTLIEANWANNTLSDLAAEMTDSLSRSGEGGMLAPLRFADGTVGAPGFAWTNETSSGFYRYGSGDMRISIQGVDLGVWTSAGFSVPAGKTFSALGNATVAGTLGVTGVLTATGGVVGNVTGNVSGNASTVTNGVYTTGDQTIAGNKTFSNTIIGSISGNAATVTDGVYTTGTQTINGTKNFSGSISLGGVNSPATNLDVQTTGANSLTSLFTTGLSDLNFRIGAMNGAAGSTGTTQGKLGLFYLGVGETATIDFRRGSTTTDGSFAFRTSGTDRATLDNSGNFTATGNITANSDERLKTNWRDLSNDFIKSLAGVKVGVYDRKDTGATQVGVSAQSLQDVLPQAVNENGDGMLSVAYGNAALAACVQLAKEVVSLREQIAQLKGV